MFLQKPVNTRRFDVVSTFFNVMNVRWTSKQHCVPLCAYKTIQAQDVLTSFQRFLNVMDVRWTLKQRCVVIINCFTFLSHTGHTNDWRQPTRLHV